MSEWNSYKREEVKRIEPGEHRVCIVGVDEATSKSSGKPMIVLSLRPGGSNITIKHYIVKNEYFNRNMTEFFDSFDIEEGDFNFVGWIGAMGAARLVEDEGGFLKVRWFIKSEKAEGLPQWEGNVPERQTVTEFSADIDEENLPL